MTLQVLLFFLLTPVLIWAFNTFDNLIRLEHENFHQQWLADGKPSGLYWRPADYRPSFHCAMATQKSMLFLLFRKPGWTQSGDYASTLLRKYRILVLTWNVGVVFLVLFKGWFP